MADEAGRLVALALCAQWPRPELYVRRGCCEMAKTLDAAGLL